MEDWAPPLISFPLKVFAVIVATFIQQIISGFYSAIRGGKMVAGALINIATERGIMEQLPDSVASKPFDPDMSYLDEFLAYPLAGFGFYYQFTTGFNFVPFPANIILFPLEIIEWIIRWKVFAASTL